MMSTHTRSDYRPLASKDASLLAQSRPSTVALVERSVDEKQKIVAGVCMVFHR